jgi:uncharacterized protein (TIGR00299 family) protein
MSITVWVDATAGVAGDMLAGAFVDAGVPIDVLQDAVNAVLPDAATLAVTRVQRNGLHATKFDVHVDELDSPPRHLSDITGMLQRSELPASVRDRALAVFGALAAAEAAAHGISIENVHFHEVGAVDSIADIVAVCTALHWLAAGDLWFSEVALGAGIVRTEHGELPVPTPAALHLTRGLRVHAGGKGELATPTGLALLTALGTQSEFPVMRIRNSGTGAGTKDFLDRANVVRVVIGETNHAEDSLVVEANVDDMDPRLWPAAIEALLVAGAADAWLTPIVMKKGRPALTLTVLCTRAVVDAVLETIFGATTTIGVRIFEVRKVALDRKFEQVSVLGHTIAVKLAGRGDRIYNVSLEFEDIARAAVELGQTQLEVLRSAEAAAEAAGFVTGAHLDL